MIAFRLLLVKNSEYLIKHDVCDGAYFYKYIQTSDTVSFTHLFQTFYFLAKALQRNVQNQDVYFSVLLYKNIMVHH